MQDRDAIYVVAPQGWDETQPNPFTHDGSYGPRWSCFRVLDELGDRIINGRRGDGPYGFMANRGVPGLATRLADFIRYEASHGRMVIVSCPDAESFVEHALEMTPQASQVRAHDPRWLVHSTTLDAWVQISSCGELRSLARLRRGGVQILDLGFRGFGEPADYAEHVILGRHDHFSGEHVVASHGRGSIITDEDAPYEPGVRLYFDAHRIILDGLGVRDGLHILKVHDHLPLVPYLVASIGVKDVDPAGRVQTWTPRTFLDAANGLFLRAHDFL